MLKELFSQNDYCSCRAKSNFNGDPYILFLILILLILSDISIHLLSLKLKK